MYLSKIDLDPSRRLARKCLGSPQVMHAVVMKAAGNSGGSEGRVLWRVDRSSYGTSLFILSPGEPDFSQLEEGAGVLGEPGRTLDYEPFLAKLSEGQEWAFRLTANPVRALWQGQSQRGKLAGHVTAEQQRKWLIDRAERNGFELLSAPGLSDDSPDLAARIASRERPVFGRKKPSGAGRDRVTINRAVFEGLLRVTDVELLRSALTKGIGRSKAYGCGLLTLAKPKLG